MQREIIFHPESEEEFRDSVLWYKSQQPGLDLEFARCIDEAIQRISRNPELYPIVFHSFRKVVVRRFPFLIIYEFDDKQIRILGVFHSRRNPKLLSKRKYI
ncbi:MAG: type II toxin-antitoxin system RelE/ParE family toxin [bacterium]